MAATKRNSSNEQTPSPVERPREEDSLRGFRTAFERLNEKAREWDEFSEARTRGLDEAIDLHDIAREVADAEWRVARGPDSDSPGVVSKIRHMIELYVKLTHGTRTITLDDETTFTTPAVKSAETRGQIHSLGLEILTATDAAITAAYERIAKLQAKGLKLEADVKFWLGFDILRQIFNTWAAILDHEIVANSSSAREGIEEAFRGGMKRLGQEHQRRTGQPPRTDLPLAFVEDVRVWHSIAREVIATENTEKRSAVA